MYAISGIIFSFIYHFLILLEDSLLTYVWNPNESVDFISIIQFSFQILSGLNGSELYPTGSLKIVTLMEAIFGIFLIGIALGSFVNHLSKDETDSKKHEKGEDFVQNINPFPESNKTGEDLKIFPRIIIFILASSLSLLIPPFLDIL